MTQRTRAGLLDRPGRTPALAATVAALVAAIVAIVPADAREPAPPVAVVGNAMTGVKDAGPAESTVAGADLCKACHAAQFKAMRESSHRVLFTKDSLDPEQKGCEACHRPSSAHAADPVKIRPQLAFKNNDRAQVNKACLACHRHETLSAFRSNGHGRGNRLDCTACHSVHKPGADRLLKEGEPTTCYRCHPGARAQMNMPSHHPVREGKMKCTGCHNPHGSPSGTRGMLARESVNETCLKCHENIAGPWTFEHAPVAKNCLSCHRPHGSVVNPLLTQQQVTLCVRCHNPNHAGFAARTDTPKSLQRMLAYQSCTHCHPRIHGSDQDHGFTN
ncbi:MAG: DmsE family decaheme c-type cytochrome [Candidatus Riflebacteria bacterium]|nr:DmsE family decaheme c-type cytochrome [Candidatus Riflebacteria bacterium]